MGDQFKTPCALPTEGEREALTLLIEECAEVQQRATKMLRFGRDEIQPGQPLDNSERLSREIGDLSVVIDLVIKMRLCDQISISIGAGNKFNQLEKYLQSEDARTALTRR